MQLGHVAAAKPQPQLDQLLTRGHTLTVLQRIDGAVEDILATAGHVTLYEFQVDDQTWSRKDVEGSLFVVKRREQPRFQFIVMNRRSTENLVEDLLGEFEYEVQVPYLLYRNASQEVNGIWFYNQQECEEIAKLFARILNAFSKAPPKAKVLTPPSREFEELEAVPTAATVEGPLEPLMPPTAPAEELQPPENPFEHFFAAALQMTQSSESSPPPLPQHAPSQLPPALPPTLPPPVHTTLPSSAVSLQTITSLSSISSSSSLPSISNPSLIKPSFFVPPPLPVQASVQPASLPPILPSSSAATSLPLQPHGAPLLQPFPPPAPSPSLAVPSVPLSATVVLTKEGVRSALSRLAQDDRFIDFVYQEILAANRV